MDSKEPVEYCAGECVTGSEKAMDMSGLAARLRTAKMKKIVENQPKPTLTRTAYWEKHVNSKETAFEYFKLYYPEYPLFLQAALAARCEQLAEAGDTVDGAYKKQKSEEGEWDWKSELEEQGIQI